MDTIKVLINQAKIDLEILYNISYEHKVIY